MADTAGLLDDFEQAWLRLRTVVEQAGNSETTPSRDALVLAVDRAVRTRHRARIACARKHNSGWVGDQELFEREVKVGALARELDGFVEAWRPGGGGRARAELLESVRPLLVEPGNYAAHELPDEPTGS
ncbi:MAG: hypothetical protein JWO98_1989 [Frankiales bacterium]|nr:hypothetical protein [Frankiales bacterium]